MTSLQNLLTRIPLANAGEWLFLGSIFVIAFMVMYTLTKIARNTEPGRGQNCTPKRNYNPEVPDLAHSLGKWVGKRRNRKHHGENNRGGN